MWTWLQNLAWIESDLIPSHSPNAFPKAKFLLQLSHYRAFFLLCIVNNTGKRAQLAAGILIDFNQKGLGVTGMCFSIDSGDGILRGCWVIVILLLLRQKQEIFMDLCFPPLSPPWLFRFMRNPRWIWSRRGRSSAVPQVAPRWVSGPSLRQGGLPIGSEFTHPWQWCLL